MTINGNLEAFRRACEEYRKENCSVEDVYFALTGSREMGTGLKAPAARVEQPTPRYCCQTCGKMLDSDTAIYEHRDREHHLTFLGWLAAPVVAQRPDRAECALSPVSEHGSITQEDSTMQEYQIIFHVTTDNSEFADQWRKKALAILDKHQAELMPDTNADIGAFCSGHVCASQRTEGEVQE